MRDCACFIYLTPLFYNINMNKSSTVIKLSVNKVIYILFKNRVFRNKSILNSDSFLDITCPKIYNDRKSLITEIKHLDTVHQTFSTNFVKLGLLYNIIDNIGIKSDIITILCIKSDFIFIKGGSPICPTSTGGKEGAKPQGGVRGGATLGPQAHN